MANPKDMTTVKITARAAELARIAAAIRQEKLSEYCSRVLTAQADTDIEAFRRQPEPAPAPKRPTRPRKDGDG